jgi:hypothetical protein
VLSADDIVLHAISPVPKIRTTDPRRALEHLLDHEHDTVRPRAQAAFDRLPRTRQADQ